MVGEDVWMFAMPPSEDERLLSLTDLGACTFVDNGDDY